MRSLIIFLTCAVILGCDTRKPNAQGSSASSEAIAFVGEIYGVAVDFGDPVVRDETGRSFNGDGASLYVFDLPLEVRQRFEAADEELMTSYPRRPDYRSHWSVVRWSKGPIPAEYEKYVDFAMSGAADNAKKIRDALSHETTIYSFFHNDHGDRPGDIDLFVVDLEAGKIYEINVNT